jgi:hypothetical protein
LQVEYIVEANQIHRQAFNFHNAIPNERALTVLLHQAGFCTVRRWFPGSGPFTALPDWSCRSVRYRGHDYSISLNLEGIKS